MSGYDIKRAQKNLGWLIGIPSFGSLYPTLHGLLKDGLVTVEVEPGSDKPSRKVYSVTLSGRQELRSWADQPHTGNSTLKTFVMELNLASSLSRPTLIDFLERRREQIAAQRGALEQQLEAMGTPVDLGRRLVTGLGLALAGAELDWLDRTLARLTTPL
jgi:DNA-binding PadR family transcriptional regulator